MILVLHPTEQLKLRNLQKKIIHENPTGFILYEALPLWIDFSEIKASSKEELKNLSKEIAGAELSPLQLDFETRQIYSTAQITFRNKDLSPVTARLPLLYILDAENKPSEDLSLKSCEPQPHVDLSPDCDFSEWAKKICSENKIFPCRLKQFKVSERLSSSPSEITLGSFQWVKL